MTSSVTRAIGTGDKMERPTSQKRYARPSLKRGPCLKDVTAGPVVVKYSLQAE